MAHKYKIKGVLHSAHISNLYCWFSFSWLSFRPVVLPGSPLVKYVKNLFLVGSKDARVVWWERGMCVCPLSCVALIVPLVLLSPPCALQRKFIQFYTVRVFICLFLWFSHLTSSTLGITLLINWSYSCSQALSFKNANKLLVCGKMIVRAELCSL